jgi:hypothetical protein
VLIVISLLLGFSNYKFDGEGKATITPQEVTLLEKGEYTIRFTVGEHGINVGGGIKTHFPKRWKPQKKDPTKNNFLKTNLSRKESGYKIRIKNRDDFLDGQHERNAYTITVTITQKPLIKGDIISLTVLRKKSRDSSAYTETLPVASDTNGDGNFEQIENFPQITIQPGPSQKIYVTVPTIQQAGKEFYLRIAVLDWFNNAAKDYTGTIEFISSDENARLPKSYTFTKNDGGIKKLPVVLSTPGYHTVTVYDKSRNWRAISNLVECKKSDPKERIWWGDIHSHSEISFDGTGNGSFEYARDIAGLDFYSLTDHSSDDKNKSPGITDKEWNYIKQKTMEFYEPGKFVTILGYECSMRPPSGHHNVYFNCSNNIIPKIPIVRRSDAEDSILTLWKYLQQKSPDEVDVITIPHHTGKISYTNFEKPYQNPGMRVAIEIFSRHGSSEKYNPSYPFSFDKIQHLKLEKKRFTKWHNGPHYAQDAWARKLYLGVIASSDDHQAHPGMPFIKRKNILSRVSNPLVAAYAGELTRDSIFDAIKSRYTYATTGERIILNFTLNGYPMGSEAILPDGKKPNLSIKARGTDFIDFIEVLKWDFNEERFDKDHHPIFETILHKRIKALNAEIEFVDKDYSAFCLYYVRLKQLFKKNDKEVWAWSSPIWVKRQTN